MKRPLTLSIALVSVALTVPVLAQSPSPGAGSARPSAHPEFMSIDKDKDGRLSTTEARTNTTLSTAFGSLDTDKDGYLNSMEFSKWKGLESMPPSSDRTPGETANPRDTTVSPGN